MSTSKEAVENLILLANNSPTGIEEGYTLGGAVVQAAIDDGYTQNLVSDLENLLGMFHGGKTANRINHEPAFALGAIAAAFEKQGHFAELERTSNV